jgi:hypothetical protein
MGFKQALETLLRQRDDGFALNHARQLVVYERFLARMVAEFGGAMTPPVVRSVALAEPVESCRVLYGKGVAHGTPPDLSFRCR